MADTDRTREWSQWIHFSVLAGLLVPVAGLVLPIVLWQVKKQELPGVDVHGRIVANWVLSAVIYAAISAVLVFALFLGFFLLLALGVLCIVFPIVGGVRAGSGEAWAYPLSIPFFPRTR